MAREAHELGPAGVVEAADAVDGEPGAGRERVAVPARRVLWREALRPAAVEARAVEDALRVRPGLWRAEGVDPAAVGVDLVDGDRIAARRRDGPHLGAVARDDVDAVPAVAVAHPGEVLAVVEPDQIVHGIGPRVVGLDEDRLGLHRLDVRQKHLVALLEPVEVLDDELGGGRRPVHPRGIMVALVVGEPEPARRAARGRDDADLGGAVGGARLRVLHRDGEAVERVRVVDHQEVADAAGVEAPVGDVLAVGAPAEAVAEAELLLVDPVEGAVDDRLGAVRRERRDGARGGVLDVEVVLGHVGHAVAVGAERREHQRGLWRVAAELAEVAGAEVQHPVVAAGVGAPDAARVGVEEHALPVVAEGVVLHRQRLVGAFRRHLGGGHEDLLLARRDVRAHEVAVLAEAGRVLGVLPAEAAGALAGEVAGVEEPLQRDARGVARGRRLAPLAPGRGGDESREEENGAGDERAWSGGGRPPKLLTPPEARRRGGRGGR